MHRRRQQGVALTLVVILGVGLMILSAVSLSMSLVHGVARKTGEEELMVRQIAESAMAQALALIKEGGMLTPMSGNGTTASWVSFSGGSYLYETDYDASNEISTIRAWGRVPVDDQPSTSTFAPDDIGWDGDGWLVRGVELTIQSGVYVPEFPVYFGNGGIERPRGGFNWNGGTDLADPSTWGVVTGFPSSYQDSSVPFETSALDHPIDYLHGGSITPTPSSGYPHPYQLWASQNPIGQFNTEAWFKNSASHGDPTTALDPPPTSMYYDMSDSTSPDNAYPVRTDIPDVQDWSHALWSKHNNSTSSRVTKLHSGSQSGTYGDLNNPSITFVTGNLKVNSGKTFKGTGILVIRDDYDPNAGGSNTPNARASLTVSGTLEWTGLVIVAGWAPTIRINSGGDATIVGALFGEDSVQSGGEVSLDSATIILRVRDPLRIKYSNGLFAKGGLLHEDLPSVHKTVVGVREISATLPSHY